MATLDLFKELYFHELERRDTLNESLTFPVGLVALLGGGISVMAPQVSAPLSREELVLAALLTLATASLLFAIFRLCCAYVGYTYRHLTDSVALRGHHRSLLDYHRQRGCSEDESATSAERDFETDVLERLASDTKINSTNNDRKSAHIFVANVAIVAALGLLVAAAPAFTYLVYTAPDEPHLVTVTNWSHADMAEQQQPSPSQGPSPQPAPQEPQRPQLPPSREVKEHVVPRERR